MLGPGSEGGPGFRSLTQIDDPEINQSPRSTTPTANLPVDLDQAGVEAARAIPISTDAAWQLHVAALMRGVGGWLEEVDAAATRVRVCHFTGPVMSSLQMRPGPHELFEWLDNTGPDTLGMAWSKAAHLAAWKKLASEMGSWSPAFAKRAWAFDFTVLPMSRRNASQLFLDTADQQSRAPGGQRRHLQQLWRHRLLR